MLVVETIAKIRREYFVAKKGVKTIAREMKIARNTIRKVVRGEEVTFQYQLPAGGRAKPKLGPFVSDLERLLAEDAARPRRERRTAKRLCEALRALGYAGTYNQVQRHAKAWKAARHRDSSGGNGIGAGAAFVPLRFAPGEAYQFDWSHERVEIGGVPVMVKLAHLRLCYSRMSFLVAYPRETAEMVFDAHDRAFHALGGSCRRGIYDNMSTAVDVVFVGKARVFNRRFLQLCSHHLVEPVACTPGAAWEKGQVERQVDDVRDRLFRPRPRVASLAELNRWLADRVIALAKETAHPEQPERTVWQVYEEERRFLIPFAGRFAGYSERPARVTKTCLVHFDSNRYSVDCRMAGRVVQLRAYADRVVATHDGQSVAEHPRYFGRGRTVYDVRHYLAVLQRKPGAIRNGAPFQPGELPSALAEVRRRLADRADGERQCVAILSAILEYDLATVEAACAEALSQNAVSADIVLSLLHRGDPRRRQPGLSAPIAVPERLRLQREPAADPGRYDALLLQQPQRRRTTATTEAAAAVAPAVAVAVADAEAPHGAS
jgi:transposase